MTVRWLRPLLLVAANVGVLLAFAGDSAASAPSGGAPFPNLCPQVGQPATLEIGGVLQPPENQGTIVASQAVVENGRTVGCIVRAEGSFFIPPSPGGQEAARALAIDLYVANVSPQNPAAVLPASHIYYEYFCNVELAGHEWFHIEVIDQHLHQRYQYNLSNDARVLYDGVGRGGGRKTVQWWTDVLWGGGGSWSSVDYGATAWGLASGSYSSGGYYWANLDEQCEVRADGSSTGYWQYQWFVPGCLTPFGPCWHIHPRVYGGYPPDW